jgi:hypothetical protein
MTDRLDLAQPLARFLEHCAPVVEVDNYRLKVVELVRWYRIERIGRGGTRAVYCYIDRATANILRPQTNHPWRGPGKRRYGNILRDELPVVHASGIR